MQSETRLRLLKIALVTFGGAFFLICSLGMVWPPGWMWQGGESQYYLKIVYAIYAVLGAHLVAAAKNPTANRCLISFAIWSSVAHAAIMAAHAIGDSHERTHLAGEVSALLFVAGVLWYLSPTSAKCQVAA